MTTTVTVLLVSHDGSRWLPAVLNGVSAQTRAADGVVAVDTGSTDESPQLLRDRLGDDHVLTAPPTTSYGAAVATGLGAVPDSDWVWLLHDDSAPAPDALEQLLTAAEANPTASILGPKLREWPSLRRLLEIGVTISGTGSRETGLERGEYDQGQHDRIRDVLAVNTAGMLVRRSLLESLGFDKRLPVFGNDIDFGWRAARAGHRALVVPEAVVFHVEAAHRGVRRTRLTGRHFRRGERAAALYTLLVNGPARGLPFRLVRLFFGSLVRVLGLLLVRAPGEAADELAALFGTYLRPFRVIAGRRARRRSATVPHQDLRHLLAPPWVPYRHGLDFLGDVATAVVLQASDVNAARRARAAESSETGPVPDDAQNLPADTGLVARLLVSPVAWVFAALTVAAVVGARDVLGAGLLSGGSLLPAPGAALDWWRLYLASAHDVGIGSTAPAAPYVLPLAMAGTLLLGKAWLVVDLLFLLAVPLAAWGGYRFLKHVTSSVPMSLWGAAAYGVLPVVTGAVQQGRLGTVVGAVALPWLAHAAMFLTVDESKDRRSRAVWRTSLWLAVLTAFVPLAMPLAALVAVVAVVLSRRSRPSGAVASTAVFAPLLVTLVLLLPWTMATWTEEGLGLASWLFEAGLPSPTLTEQLTRLDVLLGRPGEGAPAWMSVGVMLAALVALVRPDTRRMVLRGWVVLVLALAVTAGLAVGRYSLASSPVDQPLWLGFPLLVAQAAAISAAAMAGAGIRSRLAGRSFGWRQPLGVVVVLLAGLTPVVTTVWWAWSGSDGPLDRQIATGVPTYMTDASAEDPANGVLVVRGSNTQGFSYVLLRAPGVRIGEDSVLPTAEDQQPLTDLVQNLATAPEASDVRQLSRLGVAYIYAPVPADVRLMGNLDTVSGVSPASAVRPGARAWQLDAAPSGADLSNESDVLRPWLLVVQGAAVLVVGVLAAPTRKVRR